MMSEKAADAQKPVWVLCHGESEDHRLGLATTDPRCALTEDGAREIARAIVREPALREGRVAIISCPYLKTIESAQIAGEILNVSVGVDSGLSAREIGEFEGSERAALAELWDMDSRSADHTHRGAESLRSVSERAGASLEAALAWEGFDQVLLVSHPDVLGVLIAVAAGEELTSARSRCPFLSELRRLR